MQDISSETQASYIPVNLSMQQQCNIPNSLYNNNHAIMAQYNPTGATSDVYYPDNNYSEGQNYVGGMVYYQQDPNSMPRSYNIDYNTGKPNVEDSSVNGGDSYKNTRGARPYNSRNNSGRGNKSYNRHYNNKNNSWGNSFNGKRNSSNYEQSDSPNSQHEYNNYGDNSVNNNKFNNTSNNRRNNHRDKRNRGRGGFNHQSNDEYLEGERQHRQKETTPEYEQTNKDQTQRYSSNGYGRGRGGKNYQNRDDGRDNYEQYRPENNRFGRKNRSGRNSYNDQYGDDNGSNQQEYSPSNEDGSEISSDSRYKYNSNGNNNPQYQERRYNSERNKPSRYNVENMTENTGDGNYHSNNYRRGKYEDRGYNDKKSDNLYYRNGRRGQRGQNYYQEENNQDQRNPMYENKQGTRRKDNYQEGNSSQFSVSDQGGGNHRGRGGKRDQHYYEDDYSYNSRNNKKYMNDYKPKPAKNKGKRIEKQQSNEDKSETENADGSFPEPKRMIHKIVPQPDDNRTQKERLIDQLTNGTYECMVCCDRVKPQQAIWSCRNCYHCYHIGCIKKWAATSKEGQLGWRCPACQNLTAKVPNIYKCFCGKVREPEWNRRDTPHTCGEMCGAKRGPDWCTHRCNVLCHPGPCPDCTAFISRSCSCGKQKQDVKCSQVEPFQCSEKCEKLLNCGVHTCPGLCHEGDCDPCEAQILQVCHCGKEERKLVCVPETAGVESFICDSNCEKPLDCGNHKCESSCHEGTCNPCNRKVESVNFCPCDKVPLSELYEKDSLEPRKSCLDPIPSCGQTCGKTLKCGVPGSFHTCSAICHEGPCPPCPKETPVKCRCGIMDRQIPCSQLTTKADEVLCTKQCKKIRHCGRHRCGTKCCIDVDHICTSVCGKTLSCGLHRCEDQCHRGNCGRCLETSFEELSCYCGASIMYPPIPCGTFSPPCDQPCTRPRNCDHPVAHTCHSDQETCAPCTMLVKKICFKGHKWMCSTPCYVTAVSCGDLCDLELPCGTHKCQKVCHDGECVQEGTHCPQKCNKVRESCGHLCGHLCHPGECPDTQCKEMVKISCICGNRTSVLPCAENDREYRSMATRMLASHMNNLNAGCSIDLTGMFTGSAKADKLKRLQCNEKCEMMNRNQRMALALQIENPESKDRLGANSTLIYSDFLKDETKKDFSFAHMIHNALTDLVMKARDSSHKSRSHSFAPMNRDKRHFIHDYCKHFGCSSQSYDEEPKKNVVATAMRGMCFLPPISIVSQVQRELGQKKVPNPVWCKKPAVTGGMKKLEKRGSVEKDDSI